MIKLIKVFEVLGVVGLVKKSFLRFKKQRTKLYPVKLL